MQVEYSLSELLGTRIVSDFGFLEYLHLHNEISWGMGPNSKHKTHILYSLKIILHYTFSASVFQLWPIIWSHFSFVASCQCSKSFGVWDIPDFGFLDEVSSAYRCIFISPFWELVVKYWSAHYCLQLQNSVIVHWFLHSYLKGNAAIFIVHTLGSGSERWSSQGVQLGLESSVHLSHNVLPGWDQGSGPAR
jgi:hypothetical protein